MKLKKVAFLMAAVILFISFIALNIPMDAEAGCDWSVGRYKSGSSIKSKPFPTGECTWYVDGKTDRNGWDLVFSKGSGRDAYKWYTDNLITNANRGTIGLPGDIMVFDKGSFSSVGHVAYITSQGYWKGKRAWTVRHANWGSSYGQTSVEKVCGKTITQCTFVEYDSKKYPGKLKIQNGDSLGSTAYPLKGFLYKK